MVKSVLVLKGEFLFFPVSGCVALACLALSALAQQADTPPQKCTVAGSVINPLTNEPVRKAEVFLRSLDGGESPVVISDENGRFTVSAKDGRYRLFAERNGFLPGAYGSRGPGRPGSPVVLQPGQQLKDVTIRMYPHAVINVRVVDENAEPLPNVHVQALKYSYLRGQRQLIPVAAGATNDLGEQRMHGLVPGQYFISAVYRPSGMYKETAGTSDPAKEQYAPVYFPGTHDPSGASAIEAVGGQIQTLHLAMRRSRTIRVRGRVSFQVPARINPSTMVVLLPRGSDLGLASSRPVATVRDVLGNFELVGVTPGSYTLMAEWNDSGRRYVGRELLEAGSSDIDGVAVILHAAPDVKGRVSSQDSADGALGGIRVVLHPREASGSAIASPLEESGDFSLRSVAPGLYAIMLAGLPKDHYLKSVRSADQDLLDSGFRLGPGETPPQLNVLVSSAGAQIQGLVLNESQQPAGGSTVVLVPNTRTRTDLFKSVNADQSGRFALDGIAPGGYRLFAWDEIEPGAAEDPEYLKQFENAGQPLQLKERDRQSVQLPVIQAAARR